MIHKFKISPGTVNTANQEAGPAETPRAHHAPTIVTVVTSSTGADSVDITQVLKTEAASVQLGALRELQLTTTKKSASS
jgi:hypothetical protein